MTTETAEQTRSRLRPYVERARGFSGWNPSIRTRRLGPPRPWDYIARAQALVAKASSVLDLGTGGGERLADICAGFHGSAVATEEWATNAPVAAARLHPLGIAVIACSSLALPLTAASFDVVLDRHTALSPHEVARVLRPAGVILTQQVWHQWSELDAFFPRRTDFGDHFHAYQSGFVAAGLHILDAREHVVPAAFTGLGDFVYMLCIAPWVVPDFDPLGSDLGALVALERQFSTPDGLVLSEGNYIIEAAKPR